MFTTSPEDGMDKKRNFQENKKDCSGQQQPPAMFHEYFILT